MKEHYKKLERMFSKSTINKTLQAKIKINQGTSELNFSTNTSMHNESKNIHNAYLFMAVESAAFLAANSLVEDVLVLAKSFETNYLKSTMNKKLNVNAKFIEKSMGNYVILVELTENKNVIVRAKGVFRRSKKSLENIKNYS
ncbi:MAG: hypothetical protein CMA34_06975 [Euryarchaeota archaeon]|jgi:acyl-coenzyme A thioesterase PaaI-like protein|nr:hypothetical protein [Euryarchaeota archaeon]|tara:strand:+ start:100 stop:525 length:426 start_codon:yes stop_codon:yes gene_type:complete